MEIRSVRKVLTSLRASERELVGLESEDQKENSTKHKRRFRIKQIPHALAKLQVAISVLEDVESIVQERSRKPRKKTVKKKAAKKKVIKKNESD